MLVDNNKSFCLTNKHQFIYQNPRNSTLHCIFNNIVKAHYLAHLHQHAYFPNKNLRGIERYLTRQHHKKLRVSQLVIDYNSYFLFFSVYNLVYTMCPTKNFHQRYLDMKKIAVVLSGCGVFDGSEIHESVCTLIALDKAGASYQCLAPSVEQTQVINHKTKEPMPEESRNILVEAARIARGDIEDISKADSNDFAAAIYPGGFGAAANLSDFAKQGANCTVQKDVLRFAQAMATEKKPQGFICIAPTLISKIYGEGVELTIGDDKQTIQAISAMGGKHIEATVDSVVVDKKHKVVSTPAYMLATHISEVFEGVTKLVNKVLVLTK